MKEVDKGAVAITLDGSKKVITIESTCNDKNFISNTLLKEGKLEFCELFTLIDLADVLKNADAEISNMMKAGKLPRDSAVKTFDETQNPLFRAMSPPQPYRSPSGEQTYPAYAGQVSEKDFDKMKSYLPVLYKHLPVNSKVMFKKINNPKRINYFEMYIIRYDDTKFTASGHIKTARGDMDYTGHPIVSIELDNVGSNIWSRMTTKNTGRYIAIIVDDELMSVPNVNGPIEGGKTEISGAFTIEEAEKMAASLSSGHLPVKLEFVSMKEIAPK